MENALDRIPLDRIPPDAWPLLDLLFKATIAAAAIWLALSLFVYWRRRAANLTPVTAPSRSKAAQPDFLNVDHAARREAIERGEAFERQLEIREAEERRTAAAAALKPATTGRRLAKIVTFIMSVFTLGTAVVGSIMDVSRMSGHLEQLSAPERLMEIIRAHPIGTAVVVTVIAGTVFKFFYERKWAHKEV